MIEQLHDVAGLRLASSSPTPETTTSPAALPWKFRCPQNHIRLITPAEGRKPTELSFNCNQCSETSFFVEPRFKFIKGNELNPPESFQYLVEAICVPGQVSTIGGYPGSGKTTLALQLLNDVSKGQPFLGLPVFKETPAALIDAESHNFLSTKLEAMGMLERENCYYLQLTGANLSSPISADTEALREAFLAFPKEQAPGLLVLDSAIRLSAIDENDARQVAMFMNNLNALAREFNCAVVLLHHSRKRQQGQAFDEQMALRGSGDWLGACGIALSLHKNKGKTILTWQKNRFGSPHAPLELNLEKIGGVERLVADGVATNQTNAGFASVLKSLRGMGATITFTEFTNLVKSSGKSETTARNYLSEAQNAGVLSKGFGGGYAIDTRMLEDLLK